jgi:hypothetical protein
MGKISAFKGEVDLEREGKPIPLKLNIPVISEDKIKVELGMAEIEFVDRSLLKVKPHTEITLDQCQMKRKIMGVWTKTYLSRLIKTKMGNVSCEIKERGDLVTEFETPSLVAAVRGTTLSIGYDPETGETTVTVDTGEVFVITSDGWSVFTLKEGDSITAHVDPDTGEVAIVCIAGEVSVTAADVTVTLTPGEGTKVAPRKAPTPAAALPPVPPLPPPPPIPPAEEVMSPAI